MTEIIEKMAEAGTASPMMQQYIEIKENYRDYLLFYRLGDFYEMFFEDAVLASRLLELTLTARDCGDGRRATMCGVPFHKADVYVGRLVDMGYKVAICEQTEDPALAKGLVRREVVRMVTPGTVTDAGLLDRAQNNYLAAIYLSEGDIGLAFADISTGQVYATPLTEEGTFHRLQTELGTYLPREAILNLPAAECRQHCDFLFLQCGAAVTDNRADLFDLSAAREACAACFGDSAQAIHDDNLLRAVGALLAYIRETQMVAPSFVRELYVYESGQYLTLDLQTVRNLELTETLHTKEKRGSLLWVLDRTETAMGARLLRVWIHKPLLNTAAIAGRQQAVTDLTGNFLLREELRAMLAPILDIERLSAKAVYGTANAKDLRAIAQSIATLPAIREKLAEAQSPRLRQIYESMDTLQDLYALLDRALVDEPPFSVREGGMIREGYHRDVDYLRSIKENGSRWLSEIEVREREQTGIKNLRVSFNKVFGFFIEVSKSQTDAVPPHYVRRQTLTNCERYITQELKDIESEILGSEDKLFALEYQLLQELRERVCEAAPRIQQTAAQLAELDVYVSFADVAVAHNYVCPQVDVSDVIEIKEGRHPVVERFVSDSYFVPNDTHLDTNHQRMMLITGPNMAGKSTYMRQVALIVLLAQMGSFVPAKEARIGLVDKLFTRIGASDDLASGQSTFMLEMTEVANILTNATRRSLIVYDEVGRGTSTYDGMSIARAVVEYTASDKIGARTMFATHYHELTAMEEDTKGVVNYHIAAKKRGDNIVFLRKIVRGATDDSYGIEVAKLAGVPAAVVRRARDVLQTIENEGRLAPPVKGHKASPAEPALPDMLSQLQRSEAEEAAEKIRVADINTMTPIEALNFIFELKKTLSTRS